MAKAPKVLAVPLSEFSNPFVSTSSSLRSILHANTTATLESINLTNYFFLLKNLAASQCLLHEVCNLVIIGRSPLYFLIPSNPPPSTTPLHPSKPPLPEYHELFRQGSLLGLSVWTAASSRACLANTALILRMHSI